MIEELEKMMKFEGLSEEQLQAVPEIIKQCYRLVLVACAFSTMDEIFGAHFNALQDQLKWFSEECYLKAFELGNDIFMRRMKEGQG